MEDSQFTYLIFMMILCLSILAYYINNKLDKNHRESIQILKELRADVDLILEKDGISSFGIREIKRKGLDAKSVLKRGEVK